MPIRAATADDAAGVRAIYAPYVESSAVSFETEVPTVEEMAARIARTLATHPWLVADDGAIAGYAYGGFHRARRAYRYTAEVSVYVAPRAQRRGLGRRLYEALFALLERQGVRTLVAGVTLPNPGSVALHEGLGFTPIGVYRRVGFKDGEWHDVGWWERHLGGDGPPGALVPFPDLPK